MPFVTLVAVGPAALLCNFLHLVAQSQLVVDERGLIGPLQCSLQHINRLIQSILKHSEGGETHRITAASKGNHSL